MLDFFNAFKRLRRSWSQPGGGSVIVLDYPTLKHNVKAVAILMAVGFKDSEVRPKEGRRLNGQKSSW